ncbi:MAG TPA: hypothetical protein DEP47_02080, partial [Chloroflexi bacterium]|nr:hypothetical protein [Chloroflexota bacterium]
FLAGASGGLVRIDPGQLEQVVVNLSLNARDAMPDGGVLSLETSALELGPEAPTRGAHVQLAVSDTGTGIAPELVPHIFEPFFTTKPLGEGTGLGLSVSYGLIRRYGGTITVESTPGSGTKFYVWLLSEPVLVTDEETISEQLHEFEDVAARVNY